MLHFARRKFGIPFASPVGLYHSPDMWEGFSSFVTTQEVIFSLFDYR